MNTDKLKETWKNRNSHNKSTDQPPEQIRPLSLQKPANEVAPQKDNKSVIRKFFAVDEEHKISSLKIMCKGGSRIYQPYVGISFIELNNEQGLTIHSGKRKINIIGRNLETLADHLSNLNVDWIQESLTGRDNQTSEIFIEKITFYAE